jgi:AcrR family transcriptional regulator
MRLFSEQGYAGTSVARIEAAAGLTPGAGGFYHHFQSKEAALAAGVERHLDRLGALRDIQRVLTPLGDLKAELTLIARYILTELDSEAELLRILAAEARNRPEILTKAVDQLVDSTFQGFAAWVEERAQGSSDVRALAAIGLGSLLSTRLLRDVLGARAQVEDTALVETWVELMAAKLEEWTPTN